MANPVEVERIEEGILLITLNRPDARNAVNAETARLLAARMIARNAPLSVQASRRIARETAHLTTWDDAAWAVIEREFGAVFASEDAREGATAFAEKRQPVWRGL